MDKLKHFDEALDTSKKYAQKLYSAETSEIVFQLIHAAELLSDIVAELSVENEMLKSKLESMQGEIDDLLINRLMREKNL